MKEKLNIYLRYLGAEKRSSPNTISAYRIDILQFFSYLELLEIYQFENINSNHVRNWIVGLVENNLSKISIRRKISSLKSFFDFFDKREHLKNPTIGLSLPKVPARLPKIHKKEDLLRLIQDVKNISSFEELTSYLVVRLLYETGIRRFELQELKINDVDINQQKIKVLGKGNKQRIIPISVALSFEIDNYINLRKELLTNCDNLFVLKSGKKLYPKKIYLIVKQYLEVFSSLDKKGPHTLRHSFATHLLDNGADLHAIKDLLGHSNLTTTTIYTNVSIAKMKNVYNYAHPLSKIKI